MKYAVRYYTKTGNTKKSALEVASALGVEAQTTEVPLEEAVDILFLGSSVYAAGVDKEFHCRGEFSMMHKNHPDATDIKNVRQFTKTMMA